MGEDVYKRQVMIDGTAVKNVLVDGEQHNQISLDVTNQAKVPLPETGGSGRLGIYLICLLYTSQMMHFYFPK